METKKILLKEWGKEILPFYEEDLNYLNSDNSKFKGTVSFEQIGDKALIYTNQFVGILKLPCSNVILIEPKTVVKYLELLSYSQSVKCNDKKTLLYYDPSIKVEIEEGDVFLDILSSIFLIELKRIIKKGLFREYVKKEDNINYLKGKLLISKQIKTNYICPKFQCRYFDSTIDNFTNQAILFAAIKLINALKSDNDNIKKIRAGIISCVNILKDEISIKESIPSNDLTKINSESVIRKNYYYRDILEVTKLIIGESFYKSVKGEKIRCCNFLIDMNVVFERVVFGLLEKLLKDKGYEVTDQKRYAGKGLIDVELKNIQVIPDIIILKDSIEFGFADAKYKKNISNADYYQSIVYSLVLRLKTIKRQNYFKKALLVNFTEDKYEKTITGKINLSSLNDELEDIELNRVSLFLDEDSKDYIKDLEGQLSEKIKNIF